MNVKCLASLAAVAMLVIAGPSSAEPKKGEGQAQPQGPVHEDQSHAKDDKDRKMTHGEVVSECNHRANQRELKAKDRKHFVEWCTERGENYRFDDRRYRYDRDCYERADSKGLAGTARMIFIADCAAGQDREYERDKDRAGR